MVLLYVKTVILRSTSIELDLNYLMPEILNFLQDVLDKLPPILPFFMGATYFGVETEQSEGAQSMTVTTRFTVMFWAYVPDTSESGVFMNNGAEAGNIGYAVGVGSGTAATDGNEFVSVLPGVAWQDYNVNIGTGWHHLCISQDGTTIRGYVDGVVSASTYVASATGTPGILETNSELNDPGGSFGFASRAAIALLKMWRRELSQQEIETEMNSYWPRLHLDKLASFHPFDEFGSTQNRDYSQVTNNTLTMAAGVTFGHPPPVTR